MFCLHSDCTLSTEGVRDTDTVSHTKKIDSIQIVLS